MPDEPEASGGPGGGGRSDLWVQGQGKIRMIADLC